VAQSGSQPAEPEEVTTVAEKKKVQPKAPAAKPKAKSGAEPATRVTKKKVQRRAMLRKEG
jgi:hypothetical protein